MVILGGSSWHLGREYFQFNKSKSENLPITSTAVIPQRVMIPKINLTSELVVQPIVNKDWVISETEVNYLVGSGNLDEGNMVLYAHRKPKLFGNLHRVAKDDVITIIGSNGEAGYYQVFESYSTAASNLSILDSSSGPSLTLFTCEGWNDTKRWVVKARKMEAGIS